ncbi:hypothetical protein AB1Y20_017209 [Prymnesium parvum]|uniref:Nuclear receptor-binding factor 2 MIT domain-containing protein n=1 Tax=Prymnesium parvum TaxID=97485 RepID=A0AB34I9V5_PRYPA
MLQQANSLAIEAEDLYLDGHMQQAAARYEKAAEAYVRATLSTSDTATLQSLRQLALAHSHRSHELKWLVELNSLPLDASASHDDYPPAAPPPEEAEWADASTLCAAAEGPLALLRLGSTLLGTLETLRLGAEELLAGELALPPAAGGVGSLPLGLNDSFCIVAPEAQPPHAAESREGEALAATRQKLHQLAAESDRLRRENVFLKQLNTEVSSTLVRAQRRAQDQLRLVKRAIKALREIQKAPRPDLSQSGAAEIEELRAQLDEAHRARRGQAELVRKYESRWRHLKASARQKQAMNELKQPAAAGGASVLGACPASAGSSSLPRAAHPAPRNQLVR